MHAKLLQSCLTLCNPMDCSLPDSSVSMAFSRQEHWGGLLFPPPRDLHNPGSESLSPKPPALVGGFFITSTMCIMCKKKVHTLILKYFTAKNC